MPTAPPALPRVPMAHGRTADLDCIAHSGYVWRCRCPSLVEVGCPSGLSPHPAGKREVVPPTIFSDDVCDHFRVWEIACQGAECFIQECCQQTRPTVRPPCCVCSRACPQSVTCRCATANRGRHRFAPMQKYNHARVFSSRKEEARKDRLSDGPLRFDATISARTWSPLVGQVRTHCALLGAGASERGGSRCCRVPSPEHQVAQFSENPVVRYEGFATIQHSTQ